MARERLKQSRTASCRSDVQSLRGMRSTNPSDIRRGPIGTMESLVLESGQGMHTVVEMPNLIAHCAKHIVGPLG
jgi:hypothetical protein